MTTGSMLLTGSTGAVGHEIAEQARADGWDVTGTSARGGPDAVAWRMGADPAPASLRRQWDVVVHAAARPKWNLTAADAWSANVVSIGSLRDVVTPRTHLVHVSTRYAMGLRGDVTSPDLADYRNTYEWSKAAAEREVTETFGPCTIVRPPLVIGRRSDGAIARFNGLYTVAQAIVTGRLPVLVGVEDSPQDLVSSCDVARCVLDAAAAGQPRSMRIEILGRGAQAAPTGAVIAAIIEGVNRWRQPLGLDPIARPDFVPQERWERFYLPFARPHFTEHQQRSVDLLREFIPYMSVADTVDVTWKVEPIEDTIVTAGAWWAQARPGIARRHPRPWIGAGDA